MPRDRLISGNYGQANAAQESLSQIPLPDATSTPSPSGGGQPQPPVDPMMEAIQRAQAEAPPAGYLTQPSSRPGEPVQAGLNLGPGPTRTSLPNVRVTRVADQFDVLASISSSPHVAELARRARSRVTQAEHISKRRFGPGRQRKEQFGKTRRSLPQDKVGLIPAQSVGKPGRGLPQFKDKITPGLGPGIQRRKTEDQGIQGQDGQRNRTGPKDGPR